MITENIIVTKDFTWVDIEHPIKMDCNFISEEYKLPLILIQDCIQPQQLPKFERTQNGFFFLLRIYDPWDHSEDISIPRVTNKLAIFIHDNTVVSLHNDLIYPLKKYIDMKGKIPEEARQLTHQLIRLSIASFEEALSDLQSNYEQLEREILSEDKTPLSNKRVYEFRRKLFVLKGIMQVTQKVVYNSRSFWREYPFLQQDIRENIDQLYFRLEGLSQSFDQLFALHISINERKNNEVMKILTVFASIMLPLTFIASFYGMNFDYLPGTHTSEGLVGALLIMVTVTFITVWFFAKKHWFGPSV